MKKQFLKFGLIVFGASTLVLASCEKDDVGEENDEEIITTVQLTLVAVDGSGTVTATFDDPDGPGGAAATKNTIVLAPNKAYNATIQLLNKTATPVANITTEIAAEAQAHRFYYSATGVNVSFSGLNTDGAGIPLGITSTWMTTTPSSGTVKITLRHYPGNPPNKAAADDVNSTKSGTDLEVDFDTRIQ